MKLSVGIFAMFVGMAEVGISQSISIANAQSVEGGAENIGRFITEEWNAIPPGDYDFVPQGGGRSDHQYLSAITIKDRSGKSMISAKLQLPQGDLVDLLGILEPSADGLSLSTSVAVKRPDSNGRDSGKVCYFPVKMQFTRQSDSSFFVEDEVPSQTISSDPFIDCPSDPRPVKRIHEDAYQKVLNLLTRQVVTINGAVGGFSTDIPTVGKVRQLKICLQTHNAYIAANTTVTITDPTGKKYAQTVHFEGCGEFEELNGVDLQGKWSFELVKKFTSPTTHTFKVSMLATP